MLFEFAWLIWSNEHGRWWKPQRWGYTPIIGEAGRYRKQVADKIVQDANIAGRINEVVVLAPESFVMFKQALARDADFPWHDRLTPMIPANTMYSRLAVNGAPLGVDCRILSEPNYQAAALAMALINEGLSK